jgi:tryptophanyl-tRNA synthetase
MSEQSLTVEEGIRLARENAKDIIACGACVQGAVAARRPQLTHYTGFDRRRTFIFSDFAYMGGEFYKNCIRIAKARAALSRMTRRRTV